MTNETQSAQPPSEFLREMVIVAALSAMLLTAVGGLYAIHGHPEEAAAGTAVSAVTQPGETKPATGKPGEGAVIHADVYFDFKSVRLRAEAARLLQDTADGMTHTETWAVLVTGYADQQGPSAYNKTLALRRADAVKQFLIELGVPEPSVKVVALGAEAALCDDPGKECQQINRRVHLEIRRLGPGARTGAAPLTARGETIQNP